jgi:hypothetical protein
MTTALDTLRTNILANTLTTAEQNALAAAIADVSPIFPVADKTSQWIQSGNVPAGLGFANANVEELIARVWLNALYTIQIEG